MKLKKLLSFALALAMVLAFIPAMSLTASADSTTVYATTTFSYNTSGYMETYPNFMNTKGGTSRDGYAVFAIPEDMQNKTTIEASITVTMYSAVGGFNSASSNINYLLLDDDASDLITDATTALPYISGTQTYTTGATITVSSSTAGTSFTSGTFSFAPNGAKTIIVMVEHASVSTNAGGQFYAYNDSNYAPYLTLTAESTTESITTALNSLSLPFSADETTGAFALDTTTTDIFGTEFEVAWESDSDVITVSEGVATVVPTEEVTYVSMTPSTTYDGATVTGSAQTVVVFPASRAGSTYDTGAGVYTIDTTNLVESDGVAASFEDDNGDFSISGWTSHLGGDTNTAFYQISADDEAIPDGNWAYASRWGDSITGTNYCTIQQFIPVSAGTNYLSFYTKKVSNASPSVFVYFTTDNTHESVVPSGKDQQETVTPTTEWQKMEYIFESEEDGYIAFVAYNLSVWASTGQLGTYFDDFEVYAATLQEDSVKTASVAIYAGNDLIDTYTEEVSVGTTTVTVPATYAGIYNGQYYLDGATSVTLDEDYTATLELDELSIFTWRESSAAAVMTNGTYNSGIIVSWNGSVSNNGDRVGYAYAKIPEYNSTTQYLKMTVEAVYNNGFYDGGSPVGVFEAVDYDSLKAIDLNGGSETTDALAALETTALATVDMYTSVEGDSYTITTKEPEDRTAAKVVTYINAPDVLVSDSYAAIKMQDDGSASGISVITSVSFEAVDKDLGVELVDGAQIRIGGGVDGEELADMTKSGLRFIAKVGTTNTLAADADEIGIAISADDTADDDDTHVKAENYQDDNETVFTVAITNIAESNYNTVYYAFPYVKIGDTYYYGDSVARTPYQVAAGILVNSDDDTEGTDSDGYSQSTSDSDVLYAVLNVYANKTGARLTLTADADTVYVLAEDSYANNADVFFTAEETETLYDGTTAIGKTVTLTAIGKAKFYSYWNETLRIANNNTDAMNHVTNASLSEDGSTLTFDFYFDTANMPE